MRKTRPEKFFCVQNARGGIPYVKHAQKFFHASKTPGAVFPTENTPKNFFLRAKRPGRKSIKKSRPKFNLTIIIRPRFPRSASFRGPTTSDGTTVLAQTGTAAVDVELMFSEVEQEALHTRTGFQRRGRGKAFSLFPLIRFALDSSIRGRRGKAFPLPLLSNPGRLCYTN